MYLAGSGYSPKADTNCEVNICYKKAIIAKGKMKISEPGYAVPEGMLLYSNPEKVTLFGVYSNYEDYFRQRYASSEFNAGLTLEKFSGRFGLNDAQGSVDAGGDSIEKLSFVEEIRLFKMELDQSSEIHLDPKFVEIVKNLPKF